MRRILLAAGFLGLVMVLDVNTADAQQPGNHPFDVAFDRADRNKDGFLDADELAKAYRGPNAKVIADKAGSTEVHPEHAFMDRWDTNKDGRISKLEFEKYESKAMADARASANRNRNYSRVGRPGYRAGHSHRGAGRGGNSANPLRAAQNYIRQRAAYYGLRIPNGAYSPSHRGGYRGGHHHGRRR